MSVGKSGSSGKSSTTSTSETFGTQLLPEQQGYLQNMWASGQGLANAGAGQNVGMQGYNTANQRMNTGTFANQIGMNTWGGPQMQGAQNTLGGMQGGYNVDPSGTFGRMQNPGTDPMMGVYARQLGQNFNEQIMPGLRSQGVAAGGLGGSRQGIAEGLAAGRVGQQLQDFGAQLYGQNQDRALQAAQSYGGLQQGMQNSRMQAALGAGGLVGNQAQGYMQGAQNLGQFGQQYMQNAAFGMGVPWYAQQQMQGLLGQPILENKGGYATSGGTTKSGSSGWNFGI